MYESPINIQTVFEKAMHDMVEQEENAIYAKAKMVVDVDRDELIKALDYDREQYQKGYYDGYAEAEKYNSLYAWHDLRKNPEDLPTDARQVFIAYDINDYGIGEYWASDEGWGPQPAIIIAWRYIEPFEEDDE